MIHTGFPSPTRLQLEWQSVSKGKPFFVLCHRVEAYCQNWLCSHVSLSRVRCACRGASSRCQACTPLQRLRLSAGLALDGPKILVTNSAWICNCAQNGRQEAGMRDQRHEHTYLQSAHTQSPPCAPPWPHPVHPTGLPGPGAHAAGGRGAVARQVHHQAELRRP